MMPMMRRACRWGMWSMLLVVSLQVQAQRTVTHPLHAAQPTTAPSEVLLTVEIPAGGSVKYEIGDEGLLHVDRFLSTPVAYPANYGSMPRTLAGDGDPLDALVLTRAPLHPGTLIRFRPIGVLWMLDKGARDEKVVGVPADDIDPTYRDVRDLSDLPAIERDRIEAFFLFYKALPEGRGTVELHGWGDAEAARQIIDESLKRYAE